MLRPDHLRQIAAAETREDAAHVRIVRVEAEQHLGEAALLGQGQGLEQGLLAVEVDVERALRDARRLGDLAHARAVEPRRPEDRPRPVENLAALLGIWLPGLTGLVGSQGSGGGRHGDDPH